MNKQKFFATAAVAGLAIGGLSVTAASAQSYGSEPSSGTATTSVESTSTDAGSDAGIVLLQAETDGTDTDSTGTGDDARSGNRHGNKGGCGLDDAAAAIGIDEADLKAAIEAGDTIADVAAANGVDVDTVIDAMVADKAERLAEKVAAGDLTQEEADAKLADATDRATDKVNGLDDDADDNGADTDA